MKIYLEKNAYDYDTYTTSELWLETTNNTYGLLEVRTDILDKLPKAMNVLKHIGAAFATTAVILAMSSIDSIVELLLF